jgi:hypothetical protein
LSSAPSHPDLIPIIRAIREKYNLPEISPNDDPIKEIYLGDEIILLEEFRQEIKNRLRENLNFLPPKQLSYTSHWNKNRPPKGGPFIFMHL